MRRGRKWEEAERGRGEENGARGLMGEVSEWGGEGDRTGGARFYGGEERVVRSGFRKKSEVGG